VVSCGTRAPFSAAWPYPACWSGARGGVEARSVSSFNEHFLSKYFAYRRRYVDYILAEAPSRASLAVGSELARLAFMLVGNALCGLILWTLAAGAVARSNAWAILFVAFAALPTAFAVLTVRGLTAAARDRSRVRAGVTAAAEAVRR